MKSFIQKTKLETLIMNNQWINWNKKSCFMNLSYIKVWLVPVTTNKMTVFIKVQRRIDEICLSKKNQQERQKKTHQTFRTKR